MLSNIRSRVAFLLTRRTQLSMRRAYALTTNGQPSSREVPSASKGGETPIEAPHQDLPLEVFAGDAENSKVMQAPNRKGVWSRSQNPRPVAMSGPRFERTIMEYQPAPYAAIEFIHKQPVRWINKRIVECDGGGGPLGHPKIFINLDKPEICPCTYCGLPYAYEHHRKYLESLSSTSYPLVAQGDAAEVPVSQRITDEGLGQR